ncbi:MAG: hypothetical protein ACI8UP_001883 [Porticoccaceae bacterium]|jgi:hypothetical protein
MLFKHNYRVSARPVTASSFIVFVALAGCAKANDPELFQADPSLFDDQTPSLPAIASSLGFTYEIIQGIAIFEGDIVLGKVNKNGALPMKLVPRGLGRSDAFGRWPDGIVPYFVPENSTNIQRSRVVEAIAHWTEKASITFVERTPDNQELYSNFIRFESTQSCASYVGMQGGEQPVLISDACSVGSIIHEIGHALGLFHEHTRPDRENFAQVDWNQVVAGKEINFEILQAGVQNYGPYDYGSIMHYGEYFFSATGEPTIIVPDGVAIGQRQALSSLDIEAVNNMYATDLILFPPTLNIVDEGLEIGINVTNQGRLGAQQLTLVANISGDADWQGMSADSDWECATVGSELRCDRPILQEQTESHFTLLVNSSLIDQEDISLALSSRTTDTDVSNNSFNDDASDNQAAESQDQRVIVQSAELEQLATIAPAVGAATAAQATPAAPPPPTVGVAGTAAGGSDNGFLAALAALALICHRRRRLTDV